MVFIDTPGFQHKTRNLLNKRMNQEVHAALQGVDVAIHVVEACRWQTEDQLVAEMLLGGSFPIVAAVNKIDRVADKTSLLPYFEQLRNAIGPVAIVPVSARSGEGVNNLIDEVRQCVPEGPAHFAVDQLTDRSERFLASEIVREKLIRYLGDELPHTVSVLVDAFEDSPELLRIHATIWVERSGQKAIVLGKGGQMIKRLGSRARHDLELIFNKKVHLQAWVRVKEAWTQSAQALSQLDEGW
jgi:GTP-binding protein Era